MIVETHFEELLQKFTFFRPINDLLVMALSVLCFIERNEVEHHPVENEVNFQLVAAHFLFHILMQIH